MSKSEIEERDIEIEKLKVTVNGVNFAHILHNFRG
jgi:hypothetical protein